MARRCSAFLCALLVLLLGSGRAVPDEKGKPTLKVEVDTSGAPELAAWAAKSKSLLEKWHPKMVAVLGAEGLEPAKEVKLVFTKEERNPGWVAFASGKTITISAAHIKRAPQDFGMVIHEHVHVLQAYPPGAPGWLTEGIADYVRFSHYEPKTLVVVDTKKASYRDGYRTTGKFLAWVEKTHDKEIVRKLNSALHKGEYKDELFQTATKKTLDQLWAGFLAAEERMQRRLGGR